jgi:hypothetical protein
VINTRYKNAKENGGEEGYWMPENRDEIHEENATKSHTQYSVNVE